VRRRKLIDQIAAKYRRGREERDRLVKLGKSLLASSTKPNTFFMVPIRVLGFLAHACGRVTDTKSMISSVPRLARPFSAVWKWTFQPRRQRKSFWRMCQKSLATDLKRLQSTLLKMAGSKLALVEPLKTVTPAAAVLYGKKFAWDAYTLKFLKHVKQRGLVAGKFANLTGNVMWFDNGERCWKTDAGRTFKLDLVCSDENELLLASEPSTCVHEGTFATPIACSGTEGDRLENWKLKKLEQLAQFLNIRE
jgi:hypothetical protein